MTGAEGIAGVIIKGIIMECFICGIENLDLYKYQDSDNPFNMKTDNEKWKLYRKEHTQLFCLSCIRNFANTTWEEPKQYKPQKPQDCELCENKICEENDFNFDDHEFGCNI